jgi:hypothetical protein
MSPTRGLLRGARATSLGVTGFILALAAHSAAGGAAPGLAALLLMAGLTGLAALLLTRARVSPSGIGSWLILMQVVLHEAFMGLGPSAVMVQAGMTHAGMAQAGMAPAGMSARSPFADTRMLAAHVAATALMAALLAYGEKALWLLAGYAGPPRSVSTDLPELPPVHPAVAPAPRLVRLCFADGGVGRRGPPLKDLSTAF